MFKRYFAVLSLATLIALNAYSAEWTVNDGVNTKEEAKIDPPGRKVDVLLDGKLVARLIYGEGQIKPYLHVYSAEGDCLTEWEPKQDLPHHRGIYIGWNQIKSDLGGPAKAAKGEPKPAPGAIDPKGSYDLWHFNNGGKMEVLKIDKAEGGKDSATIVATIAWRGGHKDESGSDLLLTETRTMTISRPDAKKTVVDAKFELKAARDLTLGGDLQHAGIHFRGSAQILKTKIQNEKAKNAIGADYTTAYVFEPEVPEKGGKWISKEFKFARLIFPIGEHWYTATELNAPGSPVDELSMRGYGRFGFFFSKSLKKDDLLPLTFRFVTESAPDLKAVPTGEQKAALKKDAQALYDDYAKTFAK